MSARFIHQESFKLLNSILGRAIGMSSHIIMVEGHKKHQTHSTRASTRGTTRGSAGKPSARRHRNDAVREGHLAGTWQPNEPRWVCNGVHVSS